MDDVLTLGTLTIRQRAEESFQSYKVSKKKSIGRLSVFNGLKKVGAEVGTKLDLIGDDKKTSLNLCARFPKDNLWVPIIAYTATRILPISWGYKGYVAS